ncbi:MAG: ankyrin repeat domain-containing protein [Acidiferrobacterales bacterium]|nr:ankyrin repeat domain-containing protein [Acidiferrobacterales bacterium]
MIKRKDIKLLFKSIRSQDNETAWELIESNKGIIHSTAKSPPKKDDGQIPLQVAFKTGNYEIANFLIDKGSNVNFIETDSINEGVAPVIHHSIKAVVYSILFWNGEQKSTDAIKLLRKMIENGANPNARDSYGNSCLDRGLMDTNEVVINLSYSVDMDKPLIEVFKILISAGADKTLTCETRESAEEFAENFGLEKYIDQ